MESARRNGLDSALDLLSVYETKRIGCVEPSPILSVV